MQKVYGLWLGMTALTLILFSNLALAIDNPDAPDLVTEFETREQPFIAAVDKPDNTTSDYSTAYANYLKFLDKELNTAYKTLRAKLPKAQQQQLKESQINWLKYRDREFTFIENTWTRTNFGTSSSVSSGQYKTSIVRNRVIQLMHYSITF